MTCFLCFKMQLKRIRNELRMPPQRTLLLKQLPFQPCLLQKLMQLYHSLLSLATKLDRSSHQIAHWEHRGISSVLTPHLLQPPPRHIGSIIDAAILFKTAALLFLGWMLHCTLWLLLNCLEIIFLTVKVFNYHKRNYCYCFGRRL